MGRRKWSIVKVLIVDDSEIMRERIEDMLSESIGLENITQAKDPLEAISSFRKVNHDVVILDIRMSGGSGIDVLRKIKRITHPPVVIVLTNYPYPQYRRKCIDTGADYFFDKSTEFDKVTKVLTQLKQNQSN
jgi:DNA-binding NarL/FixJ family response regulator